jgi:hypothetical protein
MIKELVSWSLILFGIIEIGNFLHIMGQVSL